MRTLDLKLGIAKTYRAIHQPIERKDSLAPHAPYAQRIGILEPVLVGYLTFKRKELLFHNFTMCRLSIPSGVKTKAFGKSSTVGTFDRLA